MTDEQNIDIRPFTRTDYSKVVDILLLSFGDKFQKLTNWNMEKLKSYMIDASVFDHQPQEGYFVATMNKEIVGVVKTKHSNKTTTKQKRNISLFHLVKQYGLGHVIKLTMAGMLLTDATKQGEYYIEHIAVSEAARGYGIGTLLLERVVEEANRLEEIENVTLYVAGTNERAVHLYERLGFQIVKQRKSFFMQLFFQKRTWYFMSKYLKQESNPKWTWNKHWWLGFVGLIGLVYWNDIYDVIVHGGNYLVLLHLLWFLWLIYFVPSKG